MRKNGRGVAFAKDENGRMVKSRLDEKMLQDIARATGGLYEPMGQRAEGLEAIYQEKLSLVPKQDLAERQQKVPLEQFEWPLLAAFILLLLEFGLSDRKRLRKGLPVIKTAQRRISKGAKSAGAAALLALAITLFPGLKTANASPANAEKAYLKGDYSKAQAQYKEEAAKAPEDPQLQFNLGAASYKSGKYDEAMNAFQAALNVKEIALQNKAYYNMGNALYRQGQGMEKSNPRDTIRKWEDAVQAYEGALKLDPKDQDAAFNRDFVKKRLEELKKQQKQNQNSNQNQDKKDQNKENSQSASKDKNKEPNKDQNKGKDKKNQKGNQDNPQAKKPDQNKEGKGKDQASSGQKNDSQNKPEPQKGKDQDRAKNGQHPEKDKKSDQNGRNGSASANEDKIEPRNPSGKPPASARAERRRRPGQMTEEQARNLLDSLKGEDQSMPVVADGKDAGMASEKERRDW